MSAPAWRALGATKPMPLCRCCSLYQSTNAVTEARAWNAKADRGHAGQCFSDIAYRRCARGFRARSHRRPRSTPDRGLRLEIEDVARMILTFFTRLCRRVWYPRERLEAHRSRHSRAVLWLAISHCRLHCGCADLKATTHGLAMHDGRAIAVVE